MSEFQRKSLEDPEIRRIFEEELLLGETTDTLEALVESVGLKQKELAGRMGLTEGRISQILAGGENLTLKSLATLGWALGIRFELRPLPFANRLGTPAVDDPPPPQWLMRQAPPTNPIFRSIELALPSWAKPTLALVPLGNKEAKLVA